MNEEREEREIKKSDGIELNCWVEEECKLWPGNVLIVWKNPKEYAEWGNL